MPVPSSAKDSALNPEISRANSATHLLHALAEMHRRRPSSWGDANNCFVSFPLPTGNSIAYPFNFRCRLNSRGNYLTIATKNKPARPSRNLSNVNIDVNIDFNDDTKKKPNDFISSQHSVEYQFEEDTGFILSSSRPGTTSLLLYIQNLDSEQLYDADTVRRWIRDWTTDYVFNNQMLSSSSALSMKSNGTASEIIFHSSSLPSNPVPIRGLLSISATGTMFIRVTSMPGFLNRSGFYASSLPGERRLLRTFVSDLRRDFVIYVIHKSPHMRLRQGYSSYITLLQSLPSLKKRSPAIILLVAELMLVADASERDIKSQEDAFLFAVQKWATNLQYGGIRNPRLPPISTELFSQGAFVSFAMTRRKIGSVQRNQFVEDFPAGDGELTSDCSVCFRVKPHRTRASRKVILIASANQTQHAGVQIMIERSHSRKRVRESGSPLEKMQQRVAPGGLTTAQTQQNPFQTDPNNEADEDINMITATNNNNNDLNNNSSRATMIPSHRAPSSSVADPMGNHHNSRQLFNNPNSNHRLSPLLFHQQRQQQQQQQQQQQPHQYQERANNNNNHDIMMHPSHPEDLSAHHDHLDDVDDVDFVHLQMQPASPADHAASLASSRHSHRATATFIPYYAFPGSDFDDAHV